MTIMWNWIKKLFGSDTVMDEMIERMAASTGYADNEPKLDTPEPVKVKKPSAKALEKMTKKELASYAQSEYGITVSLSKTKTRMIEFIIKNHNKEN